MILTKWWKKWTKRNVATWWSGEEARDILEPEEGAKDVVDTLFSPTFPPEMSEQVAETLATLEPCSHPPSRLVRSGDLRSLGTGLVVCQECGQALNLDGASLYDATAEGLDPRVISLEIARTAESQKPSESPAISSNS